jgi:subtilisin family serine protease
MILKYYDTESAGFDNLKNTIAAIHYAVRMGADVINYSGGGVMRSQDEEEALRWAANQGVLVVAAAGNDGLNSDFHHFYPADYELPNILSVGALDRDGRLLRMSNYGRNTVDVAAPGRNIYSTLPNGQHGYMSGTSQATAFATGVAALLIANDPRLHDPAALIEHLVDHASHRADLRDRVRAGGILNAEEALRASDTQLAELLPSVETTRRKPAQAN